MNIKKKGILLTILMSIMLVFSMASVEAKDMMEPSIEISGPNVKTIKEGETVQYYLSAVDNVGVASFNVTSSHIVLHNFSANISISGSGLGVKTITLSNIRSTNSEANKYISIKPGTAKDLEGNSDSDTVYSAVFNIEKVAPKDTMEPSVEISGPTAKSIVAGGTVSYKVTAVDNVGVTQFNLNSNYIEMKGFTANISISGNTVTFSNVRSNSTSANKYIVIKAGAAVDAAGNKSEAVTSGAFTMSEAKDTMEPSVEIGGPTPKTIKEGGSVVYKITAVDNVKVDKLLINSDYVQMVGFTADMKVDGSTVTFSNVKSTNNSANKYIIVKAGAAVDTSGNKSEAVTSGAFTIDKTKPVDPVDKDTIAPIVSIGNASPSGIYRGGKVTYVITFSDNKAVTEVNLTEKDIILNGFSANISISGSGLKTRTITLTNVKGNVGSGYSITIAKGVIKDAAGNVNVAVTSPKFSILKPTTPVTPSEVIKTTVKGNCIDDLSLLGDINEEITYFSSWLRAEKYTASYVQENNYVAKDERMTYMVEYYNGSTAPAPDVVFTLTIPYKVDVEEINGNGYIKSRTDKETVIEWNMGKISSKAYCRLYVRVKFNEDKDLANSKDISKVFYATLKTTAGGNVSYSYMRQLFIDKTEGKRGTYKGYLAAIDSTNSIRPEDKITRAEFAKLLADCGIVKADANSTAYKQYKDWESIPVYARSAVAALSETDIIQAFPDGTFKPNNPILMEDAIQMIAQASTYISGTDKKLTVYKPTFLYKNALKDSDGDISQKKDYIMELMRQNVIVKYDSKPDAYALRKDVVTIVNALTFRGPYVEKLPANTVKFADIRDDSVYFYNIVGAANSYSYTYDYRLWQEIVEIQ